MLNLKTILKNSLTASILTVTAMTTVWVHAAFVEPGEGPATSLQDFTQNIIGAKNTDNVFDSTAVIQNKNGSIVERLEFLSELAASSTVFYAGGDPYYCMRKDINNIGYATTTAINLAAACGNAKTCNASGACE